MNVRSAACAAVALFALSAARAQAQQAFDLGKPPAYRIQVPQFSDGQVAQLIATLDSLLAAPVRTGTWAGTARTALADFSRRLQAGRLSPVQERRVLDHFDDIARAHPSDAAVLDGPRFAVRALSIGKTAPDVSGKDLDGNEFHLSDYRGKVVVLTFWGQWCGICRTEFPYERLLLELHKNWPFAIVGVNSDRSLDIAKQAVSDNRLAYRSWWDGCDVDDPTGGPIASAWQVTGWPTVYVLDTHGVIQYVDIHHEDLLKAVRQLLTAQ
jgi:peroxiredoxin